MYAFADKESLLLGYLKVPGDHAPSFCFRCLGEPPVQLDVLDCLLHNGKNGRISYFAIVINNTAKSKVGKGVFPLWARGDGRIRVNPDREALQ